MELLDKTRGNMEQKDRTDEPEKQQKEAIIEWPELKFTCPNCGGSRILGKRIWLDEVSIFMDGRIEYEPMCPTDDFLNYICGDCACKLDLDGDDISTHRELIRWLFERYAEEITDKIY